MKVTTERLPESRVQLAIEVDQDRVDQSFEAALKRLAARTRIPGFRPGKAPRHLVERQLGRDRIMGEALDRLVPDVYNEVIETTDVDAIAQPTLDNIELDPVRLKFIVPVRPTVDLGQHREIRVEANPVEVSEEMVSEQVLLLRRRHAMHAPVDRPAQWDDFLIADVTGSVDGDPFVQDADAEFPLREGQELLVAGLAEAFIGMKKGEEKTVELPIPEDFRVERLQGKTASFTLTVKEVKEEQLPDEDDELAQSVNAEEFETFEALVSRIRSDLTENLQSQEKARIRTEAVEKLVAGATFEYPDVLIDREIDHLLNEVMGNDQRQYATYLARIGRSEAEYRATLREPAEVRLKRALALGKLIEAERIEVTPGDVDAEIDKLAAPMGDEAQRFRELFSSIEGIQSIRRNLESERTLERLVAIAMGEAPELPPAEEAATEEAPA